MKDVILVGHSFGGAIALYSYLQMPQSHLNPVTKMILVDSASYRQQFPYFITVLRTPLLNRLALTVIPDEISIKTILRKVFYDDSKITGEMVTTYAGYLALPGAHYALIKTAEEIIPKNIDSIVSQYKNIHVPVSLVWGEKDEIIPLEIGQRLSQDIAGAKLQIIKDCGHAPQEECPAETIELFKNFLDQKNQ